MAAQESLERLKQSVSAWNQWREGWAEHPDLSGADLAKCDLTGADLRGANLSKAVMADAKLSKDTLLGNANLSGATLRGAELQKVNFDGVDLYEADLREANLQGADLSGAKGALLSWQLAGADLKGAKLPEALKSVYDKLDSVKDISESARKLFLALLAACLYSWLTIATTIDLDLITNRRSSPLPIIQTPIPIVGFYVIAPLILLCLSFYFQFYLQKLWEELGTMPAVFTDGRALYARADPWLFNDLVRSHFQRLKEKRPLLSYLQARISILLAWWVVPSTLVLFWVRFLRRQDESWTIFHAFVLALSIVTSIRFYRLATRTLRGDRRQGFNWDGIFSRGTTYVGILSFIVPILVFVVVSRGAVFGSHVDRADELSFPYLKPQTWVPKAMEQIGFYPFAVIKNAELSVKPQNWSGADKEGLKQVKGADLQSRQLRYAYADGAFLSKAQLSESDLEGASLSGADLTQATLIHSNLRGASLGGAHLYRADLSRASMQSSRLVGADLSCAIFNGTNLTGASLYGATLAGANLANSNLAWADLSSANLTDADLTGADLTGADLTNADLSKADLKCAKFRTAIGLTCEGIRNAKNLDKAFFPPDRLAELCLPVANNEHAAEECAKAKAYSSDQQACKALPASQ
jgi:uncharacterized protein YjbI with pentapeptide repeats